jgi:serine/threonine protein kinase
MSRESIQFGPYRLLSLLGEGRRSRVYRGVLAGPLGSERSVAVQRFGPASAGDRRLVEGLLEQVRAGARMRHPNIAEVHRLERVAGACCLTQELVEGWTVPALSAALAQGPGTMPPKAVLELLIQACRALEHAHGRPDLAGRPAGLVHGGLDPSRLMVSTAGVVKVLGFGRAKWEPALPRLPGGAVDPHSIPYRSPERLRSQKALDLRSDLFSVGAILFELLSGRPLFAADGALPVLRRALTAEVGSTVAELDARLAGAASVVGRCVAEDPSRRFEGAGDLAQELTFLLSGRPPNEGDLRAFLMDRAHALPARTGKLDPSRDGPFTDGSDSRASVAFATWPVGGAIPERPMHEAPPFAPPVPADPAAGGPRLPPPRRRMSARQALDLLRFGPGSAAAGRLLVTSGLIAAVALVAWCVELPWTALGLHRTATVSDRVETRPLEGHPQYFTDRQMERALVYRVTLSLPDRRGGTLRREFRVSKALYDRATRGAEIAVIQPRIRALSGRFRPDRDGRRYGALAWQAPLAVAGFLLLLVLLQGGNRLRLHRLYRSGEEVWARLTHVQIRRTMLGAFPAGRRYDVRYDFDTPAGERHQGSWDNAHVDTYQVMKPDQSVPVLYLPKQPWKNVPVAFLPRSMRGKTSGVAKTTGGDSIDGSV